jgi:hypothetical protein
MMNIVRRLPAALSLAGLVGLAAACGEGRTIVTDAYGPFSLNFRVVPDGRALPKGTVTFSRTAADSSVTVRVQGIERLVSGVYQVWLGNSDGTGLVKAVGTLTEFRVDTGTTPQGDPKFDTVAVGTPQTISYFSAGGPKTLVQLKVNRATLGSNPLDKRLVLISVENDGNAAQPGDSRPLWTTYTTSSASEALKFGRYHTNADSLYTFTPTGRGQIAVRGDVLLAFDSALARPPVGYYYATYVIRRDEDDAVLDTVAVGELQTPDGTSLRSADSTSVHAVVQGRAILAGYNRLDARTTTGLTPGATPYKNFADYLITLENKRGDEQKASPSVVLRGVVPGPIRNPGS